MALPYLHDIMVADFSQWLPGAYCTRLMADLGATVIKIEPLYGDPAREELPAAFWMANSGKYSVAVNLKLGEGLHIAKELVERCDVVVEGFRPGVMDRLGLGYDVVSIFNPDIVYCSLTGFGQTGPLRNRAGHDLNYLAMAGVLEIPGDMENTQARPGIPVADLAAGTCAAFTILAALRQRDVTGEGDFLDVAMTDVAASWAATRMEFLVNVEKRYEYRHLSPTNRVFDTQDGRKLALALVEDAFWRDFCTRAGQEQWLLNDRFRTSSLRRKHASEVLAAMKNLIASRPLSEWERILQSSDLPWCRVNDPKDLSTDEYSNQRKLFKTVNTDYTLVRYPVIARTAAIKEPTPPPNLGSDTTQVLKDLGYDDLSIADLRSRQVIK